MAANTHHQRVLPFSLRRVLILVQELTSNSSMSPRKTCRKSTATRADTMRSRDSSWHQATLLRLLGKFVVMLLAGALRGVAAEEVVDIRPVWMPLEGHGVAGASIAEVFRSSEVLQMYHLQVRAVWWDGHTLISLLARLRVFQRSLDTQVSALAHRDNCQLQSGRLRGLL